MNELYGFGIFDVIFGLVRGRGGVVKTIVRVFFRSGVVVISFVEG